MSSNANSSARGRKIPISDRARRKSSTSPSSKRKTLSAASTTHRRTTSTENNSTPVSSALGEGSPASGRVYARPQPPGRTPRKTPTRGMNPPPRNMSTPTRTRGEVSAFLTPEPEDDMLRREDGTRYASRGEALFERVWKKYDPNDLGSIKASDLVDLLSRIEVEGNLPRNTIIPASISKPLNERISDHRTTTLTRDQVRDWYREASNGKELLTEINQAVERSPRPMSPFALSQMSGYPLGANDISYNPYDDLDQPTGPFVGNSTPRRRGSSPAPGILSPRINALQIPPKMYSEAEYEYLQKENERLMAKIEEVTAIYESKMKNRDDQILRLETDMASKDKQMAQFERQINDLTTECQKSKDREDKANSHTNFVEEKAKELEDLVKTSKIAVENAHEKAKKAESEKTKNEATLLQLNMQISNLKGQLNEKEAMYKKAHNEGYNKAKAELLRDGMGDDEASRRVAAAEQRADMRDESNALLKKRNQEARFKIDDLQKQLLEVENANKSLTAEMKELKERITSITSTNNGPIDDDDDSLYAPGSPRLPQTKQYPYQNRHIGQKSRIQENVRMDYTGRCIQTNLTIPPSDEESAAYLEEFVADPTNAAFEILRQSGIMDMDELNAIVSSAQESDSTDSDSEPSLATAKKHKEASTTTDSKAASESAVQTDTPPATPEAKPTTTDTATSPAIGHYESTKLNGTSKPPSSTDSSNASSTLRRRSSTAYNSFKTPAPSTPSTTHPKPPSTPSNSASSHHIPSALRPLLSKQTLTLPDVATLCAFIAHNSPGVLAACWQLSIPAQDTITRILKQGHGQDFEALRKAVEIEESRRSGKVGWGAPARVVVESVLERREVALSPSPSSQSHQIQAEEYHTSASAASSATGSMVYKPKSASSSSSSNGTSKSHHHPLFSFLPTPLSPSHHRALSLFLLLFVLLGVHNIFQYYQIVATHRVWSVANRVDAAWGGGVGVGGGGAAGGCVRVCDEWGWGWRWRAVVWEWLVGEV